ncbi:pitrilysin family protein [Hathewaya histolytica]|uniref:Zinc-dependent protease n=1 Tax=Hathewaya histolytica TaxID=1498 RepID=A0A4U9RKY2_HATHI|nr:pitrilysin family protein [Hathewaya histolytica]VTQ89500.1 zinc-dependent protease [Hathewaya histolytica]
MYEVITLKNGLRVVLENISYVKSISIGLWIENGSRNENITNSGVSHFIEHMLFKGTYNRTSKEIVETIEDIGGQINAFTSKEVTCFYTKALDNHLELCLDVLADMLLNSKFDAEDIEKEKKVIFEEIKMSEDSPEEVLSDIHNVAIWGEDPISMPILGTYNSLNRLSREHILDYFKKYYVPENAVISICGNFKTDTIYNVIEKFFGNWESSTSKKSNYTTPKILNNNVFRHKDVEQTHFSLGIHGLPTGHEDMYALNLLTNLFAGGASSNLFQKIREELSLCYTIYGYSSSLINTGVVNIYTALNSEYIKEAYKEIEKELYEFSKENLSESKLKKAKEQLKGNYILALESTTNRMFSNGKSCLILNEIKTPEDILNKIDGINSVVIDKVLNETFRKGIINGAFLSKDYEKVKKSLPFKIENI